MAIVHDHFEGSAHCVECKGYCRLAGDDRALTRFVRYVLENFAYTSRDGWMPPFIESALDELIGATRLVDLRKRAMENRYEPDRKIYK